MKVDGPHALAHSNGCLEQTSLATVSGAEPVDKSP